MQTTSECGNRRAAPPASPGEKPGRDGTTPGVPAYKVRCENGTFSVAIRYRLSAAELAALVYVRSSEGGPLTDREIFDLAVIALAVPAEIAVHEARQEILHDHEAPSEIPGFTAAECAAAGELRAYCERRALEITQG